MSGGKDGWVVGAGVVKLYSGSETSYGPVRKIGKVYKNGNFVLEGETQQWRVSGDSAYETGVRWSRETLKLRTPEIDAEIKAHLRLRSAREIVRNEAERLKDLARDGEPEVVIAAADAITKAGAP